MADHPVPGTKHETFHNPAKPLPAPKTTPVKTTPLPSRSK